MNQPRRAAAGASAAWTRDAEVRVDTAVDLRAAPACDVSGAVVVETTPLGSIAP